MAETVSKPIRLESLDTLRGFDMLWIIGSVLCAIGIGYFFSTIIYTQLNLKNQIWLTAGLLAAYRSILTFVPSPGHRLTM